MHHLSSRDLYMLHIINGKLLKTGTISFYSPHPTWDRVGCFIFRMQLILKKSPIFPFFVLIVCYKKFPKRLKEVACKSTSTSINHTGYWLGLDMLAYLDPL